MIGPKSSTSNRQRSMAPPLESPRLQAPSDPGGECVHHWLLADPERDQVAGRCKRCGATRRFPGSPEGSGRFDDYRELIQGGAYDPRSRRRLERSDEAEIAGNHE